MKIDAMNIYLPEWTSIDYNFRYSNLSNRMLGNTIDPIETHIAFSLARQQITQLSSRWNSSKLIRPRNDFLVSLDIQFSSSQSAYLILKERSSWNLD